MNSDIEEEKKSKRSEKEKPTIKPQHRNIQKLNEQG